MTNIQKLTDAIRQINEAVRTLGDLDKIEQRPGNIRGGLIVVPLYGSTLATSAAPAPNWRDGDGD